MELRECLEATPEDDLARRPVAEDEGDGRTRFVGEDGAGEAEQRRDADAARDHGVATRSRRVGLHGEVAGRRERGEHVAGTDPVVKMARDPSVLHPSHGDGRQARRVGVRRVRGRRRGEGVAAPLGPAVHVDDQGKVLARTVAELRRVEHERAGGRRLVEDLGHAQAQQRRPGRRPAPACAPLAADRTGRGREEECADEGRQGEFHVASEVSMSV